MARLKVPENPVEKMAWIKYQLDLAGSSFAAIAREGGATRQTARRALFIKYPKWERLIAAKIGLSHTDIWPERYAV